MKRVMGPSMQRVFLDDVGAVSVEGYGADRAKCPAPEGAYKGSATDVYGLGRVAYALFTPRDFPERRTMTPIRTTMRSLIP